MAQRGLQCQALPMRRGACLKASGGGTRCQEGGWVEKRAFLEQVEPGKRTLVMGVFAIPTDGLCLVSPLSSSRC